MATGDIITLMGGSGFVGTHLARRLGLCGYRVRVLCRSAPQPERAALTGAQYLQTDSDSFEKLNEAIAGSAAVINLIGILNEGADEKSTFHYAHVVLPQRITDACRSNKVPVLLHMGALNAGQGISLYLQSKAEAEARVLAANDGSLRTAVICPSIIFGEGDSFFNRFAALLKFAPFFPLGCADAVMAPVCVDEVCQAFIDALGEPASAAQRIDLAGPQDYTLAELVRFTGRVSGHKRPLIALPDLLARVQARLLGYVPGKPMTMDNYRSLQTPSTVAADSPRTRISIESRVPAYLGLPLHAQWQRLQDLPA
ncbi:complex I NDUFA9 subunit family protein [Granulosicoccaceae sp. 1_MG-2023]|nr:complex I NDUFA9 subunit family protein [Granulosicoccaceae sp. 1_MG-2023]